MSRKLRVPVFVAVVLMLAGCTSPEPNRADVEGTFRTEIARALGSDPATVSEETAAKMAEGAFAGYCADDSFRSQLAQSERLVRAWDAGCLAHFADKMTEDQVNRATANTLG